MGKFLANTAVVAAAISLAGSPEAAAATPVGHEVTPTTITEPTIPDAKPAPEDNDKHQASPEAVLAGVIGFLLLVGAVVTSQGLNRGSRRP